MDYTLAAAPLIQGLCVPVITALDAQGRLDAVSQERLVAYLVQGEAGSGAQALFSNGTTGEWHGLDAPTRRMATESVHYALSGGRGPLLWAGVNDRTAGGVLQGLEHALKLGASAAVIAPLAVEDIQDPSALFHRHITPLYQRLGKGLPVFLYDNPEAYRHGKQDHLRTREVKQLSRLDYICGVKVTADAKAAGNYLRGARNYKAKHEFGVYLGKALQVFPFFKPSQGPLGNLRERWRRFWVAAEAPQGLVPGSANLFPSAWRQAWTACQAGDVERMAAFERAFTRLHRSFRFGGVNKVVDCVKTALAEEQVIASPTLAKGTPALNGPERSQWLLAYRTAKADLGRLTRAPQKMAATVHEVKGAPVVPLSKAPALLGFGAAVVDNVIPVLDFLAADAKQKTAGVSSRHAGGVILNQVAWAQALGLSSALGGGSGSGERAVYLREEAVRLGVDLSAWKPMPGLDADEARILITPKGERAIYLEAGASSVQGLDQVAALKVPLGRAQFLVTEISLLPLKAVEAAIRLSRELCKESFLDLDVPPKQAVGAQALGSKAELERCLTLATHLKASVQSARQLVSGPVPKLAAALHKKYKKSKGDWVTVTDGAKGAYGFDGTKTYKQAAFKVKVIDSTGCGDAFHAGLMAARSAGLDLAQALRLGAAAGAVAATEPGAVPTKNARKAVAKLAGFLPLPETAHFQEAASDAAQHWRVTLSELHALAGSLPAKELQEAKQLILEAEVSGHRLHVTGVGKCEYVAGFIASSYSSTGTPAFFLHATEAAHGASGQVKAGDVIIAISNSGETDELKAAVATLKKNGAKVLGVSGKPGSWLARHSDAFLWAGVRREGDDLNLAPRASVLAEILVLNGLGVALQHHKKFTAEQFRAFHPGGSLGRGEDA